MQFHSFQTEHAGCVVAGDCRLPDEGAAWPAVVLIPDILLSRRHGFYPFVADAWASSRLVVTYDGSTSGYAGSASGIDQQVARRYTLSAELADVLALVQQLDERQLPCADSWDGRRLALVGHGKGAALALHLDRRLRAEGRTAPAALALLAPPATLVREGWLGEQARRDAVVCVPIDGQGGEVRLGVDFLEDARALQELAGLEELMQGTPSSVLLVAGEEDRVFPPAEAETLLAAGNSPKDRLVVVEKAGHSFAAAHPFDRPTVALEYVRDVVDRFFRETLS